jgi:hypothetical protein
MPVRTISSALQEALSVARKIAQSKREGKQLLTAESRSSDDSCRDKEFADLRVLSGKPDAVPGF